MRAIVCLALCAGCSSETPLAIAADRPILGWSGSSATDRNRALLGTGFPGPDEHSCAADPTRVFIAELFLQGLNNVQVIDHWAPVVPGPRAIRTLDQPELSLAGEVRGAHESGDDVLGDHPFGYDFNVDVKLDDAFAFLTFRAGGNAPTSLHTEIEVRTFPRDALGFTPQVGDRTLMRGAWILDCGHPPYDSEMHPPTFKTYARAADERTTLAAAFVAPYRSSQRFTPDPALSAAFDDSARFSDSRTKPFSLALADTVLTAVTSNADHLEAHALMTANRFDTLDWLVCAPLPKPAGARLDATWRFTARSGVAIAATPYDGAGCVRFVATMSSGYKPMALPHAEAKWEWADLSASASSQLGQPIDVRQAIIDAFKKQPGGFDVSAAPALQPDHPPRVDAYASLQPLPGADQDSPTAIVRSDDQAFPFYGRARVAWKP
jgi:hypothetical protein